MKKLIVLCALVATMSTAALADSKKIKWELYMTHETYKVIYFPDGIDVQSCIEISARLEEQEPKLVPRERMFVNKRIFGRDRKENEFDYSKGCLVDYSFFKTEEEAERAAQIERERLQRAAR